MLAVMTAEFEEQCMKRFLKRSSSVLGILVVLLIAAAIVIAIVG
jgi:hypothetical protein